MDKRLNEAQRAVLEACEPWGERYERKRLLEWRIGGALFMLVLGLPMGFAAAAAFNDGTAQAGAVLVVSYLVVMATWIHGAKFIGRRRDGSA